MKNTLVRSTFITPGWIVIPARYMTLLLMLLAISADAWAEDRAYTGKVIEVSDDVLRINLGQGSLWIGFTTTPDARRQLASIKEGDNIRAVFGEESRKNKLLSIRLCAEKDAECDEDRRKEQERSAAMHRQSLEISASHARCMQAMKTSLPERFRDVRENTGSETRSIPGWNALSTEERMCSDAFINDYLKAFNDACNLHRCGENIGGGCAHLTGYATTRPVIDASIQACQAKDY